MDEETKVTCEVQREAERLKFLYDGLLEHSTKAITICDDVIDEVAKTEAFLEQLSNQRPLISEGGLSHFNTVEVIVKARAYDRLVEIAKNSKDDYKCALFHARYPEPTDED